MAVLHIPFDSTNHSQRIRECLRHLEEGRQGLINEVATMSLMIDGDGSSETHFDAVRIKYGFPSNTVAKAAKEELASCLSKITTDSSITSVQAALLQAFNKFRN